MENTIENMDSQIEKTEFVDEAGMHEASIDSVLNKDTPPVPVNMFMEEDERVVIEVDVFSDKTSGKILSVFKKDSFDMKDVFTHTVQSFEFSVPSFEDVSLYRQRSSNNPSRIVDKNMFRNFIVAMHLKDWSLLGKDGKKVELEFESDGTLTKNSIRFVNRVPTVVWDVVLTLFERITLIS